MRRDLLIPADGRRVWEAFKKAPLRIVEIPFQDALLLAFKYKIYAYDAYIIATAAKQRCRLVTLDKKMAHIAADAGIKVEGA